MKLDNVFSKLTTGLQRAGITDTSEWAEMYRILDGKPYKFDLYPWAKEISDVLGEFCVMKGSQIGLTQLALNRAFKTIDIDKESVLYILPTLPMANRFSDTKFNPAIQESPQLRGLFTDVDSKNTKVSGRVALFILGSRSRADLKGVTVKDVYIDEYDECDQSVIKLARERSSSFEDRSTLGVFSTPTTPGHGVHELYDLSTKEIFQFKCPHCKKWTWMDWDDVEHDMGGGYVKYGNIVVAGTDPEDPFVNTSYFITSCCNKPLSQEDKLKALIGQNQFVAEHPTKLMRGFYVNQLVSPTVNAKKVARNFLQAVGDPMAMQEFKNHQIGTVHVDPDSTLSWDLFDHAMRKKYAQRERPSGNNLITIGVDIGTKIHYVVAAYNVSKKYNLLTNSECMILKSGELDDFEQVDLLMKQYKAHFLVVDAQPEKRKSLELAERWGSQAKVCFYSSVNKTSDDHKNPDSKMSVTVDRTAWLDAVYNRFKKGSIFLPLDSPKEFYPHMMALVKKYEYNKDKDMVAKYVKSNKNDHYCHALLYSNVAFILAIGFKMNRSIEDIM
jgi:phage terminase large subunit GpA-like protein